MLPKVIVNVVQIAAGLALGSLAGDALIKGTEAVKKIVESKKEEAQK